MTLAEVYNNPSFSGLAGSALTKFRLATLSADGAYDHCSLGSKPHGIVIEDAVADAYAPFRLPHTGIHKVAADGSGTNIAIGTTLVAGADGKAVAMPTAPGIYYQVGIARESCTVAQQNISILPVGFGRPVLVAYEQQTEGDAIGATSTAVNELTVGAASVEQTLAAGLINRVGAGFDFDVLAKITGINSTPDTTLSLYLGATIASGEISAGDVLASQEVAGALNQLKRLTGSVRVRTAGSSGVLVVSYHGQAGATAAAGHTVVTGVDLTAALDIVPAITFDTSHADNAAKLQRFSIRPVNDAA